jgi:uncharacterized repeat protein (TIGR03803 family)
MSHRIASDSNCRQPAAESISNPTNLGKIPNEGTVEQKVCRPSLPVLAFHGAFAVAILFALTLVAVRPAHAQEIVLFSFEASSNGCCGGGPTAPLITDANGNLYGTTPRLGLYDNGSVFEYEPSTQVYDPLYNFCKDSPSCPDGFDPEFSGVIRDSAGNLYGTTAFGGANGCGVVYELSFSDNAWAETVLYNFPPATDNDTNCTPLYGVIMDKAGNLYGTTSYGQYTNGTANGNGGSVFELTKSGNTWTEKTLYSYPYGSDSGVVMDAAGNLFAIGANASDYPYLFELSPNGKGGWTPSLVYTFNNFLEAWSPTATPVLDSAGNLYGTTYGGGKYHVGVVYEIVKGNGTWTYKDLFEFKGNDGENPFGSVTLTPNGTILGTTQYGGTGTNQGGMGTVFSLVPDNGSYKETVYSFDGTDGSAPEAAVTLYGGNIYGTTSAGGDESSGTIFEIFP